MQGLYSYSCQNSTVSCRLSLRDLSTNNAATARSSCRDTHRGYTRGHIPAGAATCTVEGSAAGVAALRAAGVATHPAAIPVASAAAGAAWIRGACGDINRGT